ncbi:DUF6934 family protein [Avibacterium gallinarum]|uniref:DUF6934 family protein n=1 Tax=Avibacterium gallinarum TaxID=755 RepID=UPI003BF7AA66
MQIRPYVLSSDSARLRYQFVSQGKNGEQQTKIIEFCRLDNAVFPEDTPLFNLGFGDTIDGVEIDDKVVTNNGDMEVILRTVAYAAELFFLEYPSALILFEGSSKARTRLYRMMLNKYYSEISERFIISGISEGSIHLFLPNTKKKFEAFLVKQRVEVIL